jgi:hypothetical protein
MARKKPELEPGSTLDYLRSASPSMLQEFELSRLNHVSNMRKQLQGLIDQMVSDMSEALLARTLLQHRKEIGKRTKLPILTPDELLSQITAGAKLLTVRTKSK